MQRTTLPGFLVNILTAEMLFESGSEENDGEENHHNLLLWAPSVMEENSGLPSYWHLYNTFHTAKYSVSSYSSCAKW